MNPFFLSQSHFIGVELVGTHLRLAKLCKKRGNWEVVSLTEFTSVEHSALIRKQLNGGMIISALNCRDLLVRTCELPVKKTKDLLAALDFHAEPLLPYPIDRAIIQVQINEQLEQSTSLSLFSIRKDHLAHHLEGLHSFGLEPEVVTSKAHALAAFSTILPQTALPILLVHEGDGELSFVLTEKTKILAVRAIDSKKELRSEIQKTLLNFHSTHKSKPFETIYFLGRPELKELLQEASGLPILSPTSPYLNQRPEELINFGLAIGCAISQRITESSGGTPFADFRQKEFAYPRPFRRLQKPIWACLTLSLLLTASLYVFGEAYLHQKKQTLEKAYHSLIATSEGLKDSTPQTPGDYYSALESLEKEVKGRPDTYPLLPQVPKVKDLLGWLASLRESEGISLESLNYQMVQYPDASHKFDKYKVKVEIEISAHAAGEAKAFHEALKRNFLIDPGEELVWTPLKGKYKISFYLKDKTKYH